MAGQISPSAIHALGRSWLAPLSGGIANSQPWTMSSNLLTGMGTQVIGLAVNLDFSHTELNLSHTQKERERERERDCKKHL